MIKTLTNLRKQEKEKFVVPKGVQDVIPITAIPHGIHRGCRLSDWILRTTFLSR